MPKKTIRDIKLKGRKVLVRCDFNVPLNGDRQITDDTRIVGAIPTIKYLSKKVALKWCSAVTLEDPVGKRMKSFLLMWWQLGLVS